ncbi:MAG TPA: type I-C CRISPR-associated protein Cas8c/Csd1 [Firmicutes bacterium]|nr:type I-C CRISPR-associated protein Cas8c/Csd1 [Bacillota bacterium]
MLINSLYQYYRLLASSPNPEVPLRGYSTANVSFAFNLSESGELLDVIPLAEYKGKRAIPVKMQVPEQEKRSSGIVSNFLCDNSTYILGVDNKGAKSNPDRLSQTFQASKDLHSFVLGQVDDPGARAVCNFFESWVPQRAAEHPALKDCLEDVSSGGNIVFRLDGQPGYIHDRPAVKAAWMRYKIGRTSEVTGQCLVTGEVAPIARLHPSIKGVRGAQSSGASLVSFNLDAFTSYGKTQSYNAPVSEEVVFGYTTALNYLLSNDRQKVQLDPGTTVVFWSGSRANGPEEDLMAGLLFPSEDGNQEQGNSSARTVLPDRETTQLVRDILHRVRNGQPISVDPAKLDLESQFYILGLSPNASRLSVRFWYVDTFGRLLDRIASHYADLAIVRPSSSDEPEFIPVPRLLLETAPLGDRERIPPLLGGSMMRSILSGSPYPRGLYTAIISRIRADHKVNYVRAAILKASLIRGNRLRGRTVDQAARDMDTEVNITVGLDEQNTNTAYRLGRLFAILEKAQQEATPGLNATIRDRYFGAASATPGAVFPQLLRLAQHHVSKAEYGGLLDKQIEKVLYGLDNFPSHLNLTEQGLFMLGYYHQRQAFYQKDEKKEG